MRFAGVSTLEYSEQVKECTFSNMDHRSSCMVTHHSGSRDLSILVLFIVFVQHPGVRQYNNKTTVKTTKNVARNRGFCGYIFGKQQS